MNANDRLNAVAMRCNGVGLLLTILAYKRPDSRTFLYNRSELPSVRQRDHSRHRIAVTGFIILGRTSCYSSRPRSCAKPHAGGRLRYVSEALVTCALAKEASAGTWSLGYPSECGSIQASSWKLLVALLNPSTRSPRRHGA